ncbi:photosystem I assembly protein Ycf4, chloroplast [Tanacetum coccineum]
MSSQLNQAASSSLMARLESVSVFEVQLSDDPEDKVVVTTLAPKEYQVGGAVDWRLLAANETELYNAWPSRRRFHIQDPLRFRFTYSVVIVEKWEFFHIDSDATAKPINLSARVCHLQMQEMERNHWTNYSYSSCRVNTQCEDVKRVNMFTTMLLHVVPNQAQKVILILVALQRSEATKYSGLQPSRSGTYDKYVFLNVYKSDHNAATHIWESWITRKRTSMTAYLFQFDPLSRRFKGCPIRDKGKKCGVYGFLDLELPGEYYKQLVYNLHEEDKALNKNKMCGVMEDSSNGYSNYSINQQMVKDLKADLTFVKSKLKVYDRLLAINIEIIVISSSSEATSDNQLEGKVTKVNEGSSKRKLPPLGSAERPRPEVTPHVAKILKYGPCPPELLTWYGYVDLDDYLEDTYFCSPEKETDDFDEFPGMTDDSDYESSDNETKIKNSTSNISTANTLLIPEDSVEKYDSVFLERCQF